MLICTSENYKQNEIIDSVIINLQFLLTSLKEGIRCCQ
jgi:hypothetical protein